MHGTGIPLKELGIFGVLIAVLLLVAGVYFFLSAVFPKLGPGHWRGGGRISRISYLFWGLAFALLGAGSLGEFVSSLGAFLHPWFSTALLTSIGLVFACALVDGIRFRRS